MISLQPVKKNQVLYRVIYKVIEATFLFSLATEEISVINIFTRGFNSMTI